MAGRARGCTAAGNGDAASASNPEVTSGRYRVSPSGGGTAGDVNSPDKSSTRYRPAKATTYIPRGRPLRSARTPEAARRQLPRRAGSARGAGRDSCPFRIAGCSHSLHGHPPSRRSLRPTPAGAPPSGPALAGAQTRADRSSPVRRNQGAHDGRQIGAGAYASDGAPASTWRAEIPVRFWCRRRAAVRSRVPQWRHCGRERNRPKSTVAFRFQRGPNAVAWPGYRVVSASIATVSARISAGSSPSVISTP